jgi:hypothetical protein
MKALKVFEEMVGVTRALLLFQVGFIGVCTLFFGAGWAIAAILGGV